MKVVLTVHQFLPDYGAGTEVLTFETAKGLQERGHEVCVFTAFPARGPLNDEERFDTYIYKGVSVQRFHHSYDIPFGGQTDLTEAEYRHLFFGSRFRTFLESTKPDLVHFFHLGRLSGSPIEACYELGIPMVLTPTDFWLVCPTCQLRLSDGSMCRGPRYNAANCVRHWAELNKLEEITKNMEKTPDWLLGLKIWGVKTGVLNDNRFLPNVRDRGFVSHVRSFAGRHVYLRTQMNRIDRVLVPTRLMESILTSNGLEQSRVVFAPYGINLTYLTNATRTRETGPLRVGFIGTLYEHKGVHLLVEAVRSLKPELALDVKIFGRSEEFPDFYAGLKKRAEGDPRIQFCGPFPNHVIGEVFSSLDVLVVPSIWYENTPLVIYSAQAAGCPVIASNLGGMAEVIRHEDNGLLFRPGSIEELARALRRLCEDRQLLERLTKRAVMPRSIEDYVQQVEAVYEDV